MTGSVVNLNKARKAHDRAKDKARADANAVKHGRTKAQRTLEATQAEKARKALDGSKMDKE